MSGIAGLLLFDGSLDATALVQRITGRMRHRGPDGIAHWAVGRLALGHCLLRATPEAAEDCQPLVDRERGLALVWDGRLDNRDELCAALRPGFPGQGASDSEYALEAYARWGEDCPRRLLGDFAFAVWDLRRQTLYCARDVMGGAPFAYVLNDRLFAFASEWEALIGLPGVSAAPNERLIAHLLLPQFQNRGDRRTWQRDVLALPGGEPLSVAGGGGSQLSRYRTLAAAAPPRYRSDAECREHFLEVFGAAVRCRTRGLGAPAVMMSGGLDSAAVIAMLRQQSGAARTECVSSYSAIGDDPAGDPESRAIQSLCGLPGIESRCVSVPSFSGMVSAGDLVAIAWSGAHPVDNSLLIQGLMCLAAGRDGHRVMAHGASGDITLHAPLRYLVPDLRRGRLIRAWRECRAASRNHVYLRGIPPLRTFASNAYAAFLSASLTGRVNRLRRRWRAQLPAATLLNAELTRRIGLGELLEVQQREDEAASTTEGDSFHAQRTAATVTSALSASGRVAARFGMEVRDPWADVRVVEYFLGLPAQYKVRNGWTKYLVRTAFEQDLPAAVLRRRDKGHLGWKCIERLLNESREFVDCLIRDEITVIRDFVDLDGSRKVYRQYLATPDAYLRDTVFQLATLITWLKRVNSLVD